MDKDELRNAFAEAQAQIQMQAQKALMYTMNTKCFDRCVSGPTDALSQSQKRCLDACTGAFLEGFGVASEALATIAKKAQGGASDF